MANDWSFNGEMVGEAFDKHVRGQLPFYNIVTNAVNFIVKSYANNGGIVYDIGASTGNISRSIENIAIQRNLKVISIESSKDMAESWDGYGAIVCKDATQYKYEHFDVAILFLTLMFMSVSDRADLLVSLRKFKKKGGCIVIVDKELPLASYAGSVMRRLTFEWKRDSGVSDTAIINKELSLSGVQRPVSREEIGEDAYEFFRLGEFCGWVIE